MKADMHIHTVMSDGENTVDEIIKFAKARNVSTIAITDHDTTLALKDYENKSDIEIIPGIELSTQYRGRSTHVLGYFIDINNYQMNKKLADLRNKRKTRARKIVDKLAAVENIILDYNEIKLKYSKDTSIGRPHIAKEMVEMGYVSCIAEAFEKYIGNDKSCYVKNEKLSTKEAVELIHESGGIAFLAHPGLIDDIENYSELLSYGFDGIEVFHPKHSEQERKYFYDLAINNSKLISGGSDFHSRKTKGKNKIASAYITEKYLNNIKEYYRNLYPETIY